MVNFTREERRECTREYVRNYGRLPYIISRKKERNFESFRFWGSHYAIRVYEVYETMT